VCKYRPKKNQGKKPKLIVQPPQPPPPQQQAHIQQEVTPSVNSGIVLVSFRRYSNDACIRIIK